MPSANCWQGKTWVYAQTLPLSSSQRPCSQPHCCSRVQPQTLEVKHGNAKLKQKTDFPHSLLLFGKLWRDLSWPFIFHLRTVIMGSRVACKEPRRLTTNPLTTKNKKCLVIWLYSKQVPPIRLHIFFTLYLKLISSMKPPQVSRNPTLYNMSSWIIA